MTEEHEHEFKQKFYFDPEAKRTIESESWEENILKFYCCAFMYNLEPKHFFWNYCPNCGTKLSKYK